ncbi:hypothetical protein cypCar_00031579 [Cyprinus carpio]|nr:hypothetical protein cypCar_00031579 [Cyprinus carpio]
MGIFVDDETKLMLHGLQQYYIKLKDNKKNRKLFDLLDVLEFNQLNKHDKDDHKRQQFLRRIHGIVATESLSVT